MADTLRQGAAHDGSAASGQHDLGRERGTAADAQRAPGVTSAPPLPREGETFTEEQMSERFGVSPPSGIRQSKTSSDIILVRRVDGPTSYHDEDSGEYVYFDGVDYRRPDQMVSSNKVLSESRENGNRVLYFVKERGSLAFHGRVKCVGWERRDDSDPRSTVTFKMRRVNDAATQQTGSAKYAMVVNIVEDEDGGYVATAPALPGCISQGETKAEARENLEEAISLYLDYLLETGEAFPPGLVATLDVAAASVRGESVSARVNAVPECVSTRNCQ